MRLRKAFFMLGTYPLPAFADHGGRTEPAVILLLVLGMVALIAGLSSLGDLRRKTLMPPRPGKRFKAEPMVEDEDEHHPAPRA